MEFIFNLTITEDQAGFSIKDQLTSWLIPRHIRGALRLEQRLFINQQHQPTSYILKKDDQLEFKIKNADFKVEQKYSPQPAPYDFAKTIYFENEDVLIVDKPADVKMHPHSPLEDDTLMNFVQFYLSNNKIQSRRAPASAYMIHRLDRSTSGLVMIGKNPLASSIANLALKQGKIKRTYLAWLSGSLDDSSGVIDLPIGKDPTNERLRKINGLDAQPARTNWTRMHKVYQKTLVRFNLETGRTHQIRVHAASQLFPIVGDKLYNTNNSDDQLIFENNRLMLVAITMEFDEFFTNVHKIVSARIPDDFPRNLN